MYNQKNLEAGIWRSLALCDHLMSPKYQRFRKASEKLIYRNDFHLNELIALLYKVVGEEKVNQAISMTLTDGHDADLIKNLKTE